MQVLFLCAADAHDFGLAEEVADVVHKRYGLHVRIHYIWKGIGSAKEFASTHPILLDPADHLGERCGLPQDGMVLMRPDGYIGFLGTAHRGSELHSYLDAILKPQTG